MNRWNRNTYNWAYRYLCARDGEQCMFCRAKPPKVKLEIDHIDNNPYNNDPANLCLLCKKHNCQMRGKKPSEHKRIIHSHSLQNENERDTPLASPATQFTKEVLDYHSGSVEMRANSMFETKFNNWVMSAATRSVELLKKEAVNSGAYEVGCNTQTTARYLDKLTSDSGPLYEARDTWGRVVIKLKTRRRVKARKLLEDKTEHKHG